MAELLSLRMMAKHLRVTQVWLRDEATAGRIPCLKAGTQLLFERSTVEAVLAARASAPHGEADNGR